MSDAGARPPTVFVARDLVVGAVPANVSGEMVVTDDPQTAVAALRAGATAVLPWGRWDLAEQTMRSMGASEEHIRFSVALADGSYFSGIPTSTD